MCDDTKPEDRNPVNNHQKGFSIVEMIVVMAIFGVVMMAVVSLYIPAARSTTVQTELSDVQSNLRFAIKRMTQDLLSAGFLVDPNYDTGGAAGAIYWQSGTLKDTTDLTIRTRIIGDAFARILDNQGNNLALSDIDMLNAFPVLSNIRIFAPLNAQEFEALEVSGYDEDTSSYYDDCVYTVTAQSNSATINSTVHNAGVLTVSGLIGPPAPGTLTEALIVKVKDDTQPPMQTIRYRVVDGALQRTVNGNVQILARNIESVTFGYTDSAAGSVKEVDITLVGAPVGLTGGGSESATKNRSLRSSVALRNVY